MSSGEYGVNIDYTNIGRVHIKIELSADTHEQALKAAQFILNQQKSWYRRHKEEAIAEHKHYKKTLRYGPDYQEEQQEKERKKQQQQEDKAVSESVEKTIKEFIAKAQGDSKGVF